MLGMNRQRPPTGPPMSAPSPLDDQTSWKGPPMGPGPDSHMMGGGPGGPQNSGNNVDNGPNSGFNNSGGGGNFAASVFQQSGQSSPAAPNSMGGPSNTPQYNPSPAPSGSSTPGPMPGPNMGFQQPPFNGPNTAGPGGPFGSPQQFGRPGSSGPPFGGPTFAGMPPGSPSSFAHGHGPPPGHPAHHPMMGVGPPGPPPQGMMDGRMGLGPPPQGMMDGRMGVPGPAPQGMMDGPPRRHNSYFSHTEHRVFELNKRLQQRTDESDNCWWDSFTTEFFEDNATLTILFCLEDGLKRYTIGRTLIPRFFRSIFEGGANDLYFHLKHAKESFHNTSITLDCDQCTVITQHGKQQQYLTKVCADARLVLEFMYDDYMRIKSWHMTIKGHREMIPRTIFANSQMAPDPMVLDQLSKNITRSGITNATLNYLRLCVILEPMQELMSRHKAYSLSPRDCLKTTLFQKWQRMVAPPGKKDPQRPANKRRKRKGSSSGSGVGAGNNTPPVPSQKRSPSGPNFSLASQDVMVVGEPTLMGGEFGEEDERLITRLENAQYEAANALDHDNHPNFGHVDSPMTGPNPNHPWMDGRPGAGGIPLSPSGPMQPSNQQPPPQQQQQQQPSQQDLDKKSPVVSHPQQ